MVFLFVFKYYDEMQMNKYSLIYYVYQYCSDVWVSNFFPITFLFIMFSYHKKVPYIHQNLLKWNYSIFFNKRLFKTKWELNISMFNINCTKTDRKK